jgi:hypothetical protein
LIFDFHIPVLTDLIGNHFFSWTYSFSKPILTPKALKIKSLIPTLLDTPDKIFSLRRSITGISKEEPMQTYDILGF